MSEPTPQILLAGPLFVGVILNWALLGALMIQIYDYHSHFRSDRRPVRLLVHFVSTVELVQTGFITHTAWWHLVNNWGKPNGLLDVPWTSTYIPVLNGIASASVQIFYAWRIWLFESKSLELFEIKSICRLSAVLIVMTALTQFSAAIWVAVEFLRAAQNIASIALINSAAETWLVGSFVCDIMITFTMVFILLSVRRQSNSKRTVSLLNNLIVSTVETGAITAVLALTQLVLYKTSPTTYMHVTIEFVLGRLYCNVLLATLNGRHRNPDQEPPQEQGGAVGNRTTLIFEQGTEMNPFPNEQISLRARENGGHSNVGTVSSSRDVKNQYSKTSFF
ncbi:hypothetical protein K438DRAFT_1947105 [Mycena galopus ATCC 62051]|nr:hypothetical protein K438DRAFT_1947105 [Mycena galopus ATCC 62051]